MFKTENRVGRLIELRIQSPVSEDEVQQIQARQLELVRRLGERFVAVTDLRRAIVFPPQVTDQFIALMQRANPMLERSGVLIADSAVLGLQAERAMREGGHDHRQAFRDPAKLEAWLGEVLTVDERSRLRAFLHET